MRLHRQLFALRRVVQRNASSYRLPSRFLPASGFGNDVITAVKQTDAACNRYHNLSLDLLSPALQVLLLLTSQNFQLV